MADMIDRDIMEQCLERLMKVRGVKSHFQTAFDAADISILMNDAVFMTEQAMLQSCSKQSSEAP